MPNTVTEKSNWEDGAMVYKIYLFGVLPCGSKTCVILENVPVYFDIMMPVPNDDVESQTPDQLKKMVSEFDHYIRGLLINKKLNFLNLGDIDLKKLHGFQKGKRPYKRIFFNNLIDRSAALDFIKQHNKDLKASNKPKLETAADDPGKMDNYFPKVAREYRFATADWNRFENYTVRPSSTTTCAYTFSVDIDDFKKLSKEKRAEMQKPDHPLEKIVDRDPTMVGSWDIETYRTIQNGMVPTPADKDFTIFMMNTSYFWHHTDDAMFEVCCVDVATNARKGISLVIECGIEKNVLIAHMEVIGKMNPDILVAFNGGYFDWPLYVEKCRRNQLLVQLKSRFSSLPLNTRGKYADTEESVKRWCFRKDRIKIDAETTHDLECVAQFPGMLDTDCLPTFIQLYTRMEVRKAASLNFFLAKNGLESKEDMPYKRMFRIYERALKLSKIKSCHCGDAQDICGLCKEQVRELDFKPATSDTKISLELEYSNDLYDDVAHCCCYCGKRDRNLLDMADVGYYCTIDCLRPQQLYVKRTIVPDKRELSTMSYVSLHDSFYRANGMKVRNVIGAYCHKSDIAFSNSRTDKTDSDKDHYPGAWVFPPNRGLHSDGFIEITVMVNGVRTKRRIRARPITGLDFSSLYPSLMMTYNLSPDKVIYDETRAKALTAEGYNLRQVQPFNFEQGPKKGQANNKQLTQTGWTVRHQGVFNAKTDKKIVDHYVKHEKYTLIDADDNSTDIKFPAGQATPDQQGQISAAKKAIRRPVYEPIHGRDALPGESMGIFAFIVKKLFDKRVPMKAEFVRLEKLKEHMELNKLKTIEHTCADGRTVTLDYKADVCFQRNKIDSKQKALKVLMNTFYGESGNYQSSIYELIVAAGITCAGQENIKKVAAFVEERGFTVHYGDSVTADTPILVRQHTANGHIISYKTIEDLGDIWTSHPFALDSQRNKSQSDSPRKAQEKQVSTCIYEVWTEDGWTKINRVIRHYTDKNIYRVLTGSGCVDVTKDHSLLTSRGHKITPRDVKIGTQLLHAAQPTSNDTIDQTCMQTNTYPTKISAAVAYNSLEVLHPNLTITAKQDGTYSFENLYHIDKTAIISITDLGATPQYVYDLETENHHFAAGIGRMIVHNTDSVYISCPDSVYVECDQIYEDEIAARAKKYDGVANIPEPVQPLEIEYKKARTEARIRWWTAQVDITMKVMSKLKEEVSDYLLSDNGTLYLNMAYEEVGFPTVFTGKKKYYMIPHIEKINFYPKDLFIRGIDIIKQGQAKISRELGMEFMRETLSPENEREMMDIAKDKIRKYYKSSQDPALFALLGRYKTNKKNVPIHTFVARMIEMQKKHAKDPNMIALYEPPEPGDKFEYVVVKKPQRYTLQGTKVDLKKGDKMEFVRVFRASQSTPNPMEIDLDYYMKSMVVGIFARFIASYPQFQPEEGLYDLTDKEQYKLADNHCVNQAADYLEEFCDQLTGYDKTQSARTGRDYQKIYRSADKALRTDLRERYGSAGYIVNGFEINNVHDENKAQSTRIIEQMRTKAKEMANITPGGAEYINLNKSHERGVDIFTLRRVYTSSATAISRARITLCDRKEQEIIQKLYQNVPDMARVIRKYEKDVVNFIEDMRIVKTDEDIEIDEEYMDVINDLGETAEEIMSRTHMLFLDLVAVNKLRAMTLDIVNQIEITKANLINEPLRPTFDVRTEAKKESLNFAPVGDFNWM